MTVQKEKTKTRAEMQTQIAGLVARCGELRENREEERRARIVADEALKESRSHFADLKKCLLAAETENARLNGYLSRVHEDDVVRDGMIQITDEKGTRQVPKRPPPARSVVFSPDRVVDYHRDGSRSRKTHWTDY